MNQFDIVGYEPFKTKSKNGTIYTKYKTKKTKRIKKKTHPLLLEVI